MKGARRDINVVGVVLFGARRRRRSAGSRRGERSNWLPAPDSPIYLVSVGDAGLLEADMDVHLVAVLVGFGIRCDTAGNRGWKALSNGDLSSRGHVQSRAQQPLHHVRLPAHTSFHGVIVQP